LQVNNKYFTRLCVSVATIALLVGCSSLGSMGETADKLKSGNLAHLDAMDPHLNLNRDDYVKMNSPKYFSRSTPTQNW